jgi:hypothetical protein
LDRHISGFLAFENSSGVNALQVIRCGKAGAIAEKAADVREVALRGDRWNGMA